MNQTNERWRNGAGMAEVLACQSCPSRFGTPWRLLQHAQNVHSLKIYLDEHSDPPDATWTVARSAEDAWRMVLAHDVQAMSLGCDMGQCEACVASASLRGRGPFFGTCYHRVSGLEFCSWLAKAKLWPRARPTVHSVGLGAFQMRKIIARDFQLLESVDRLRPSPDADGFGR